MPWQNEDPTTSRPPRAGCPTQDPQTAPSASGGTAAPGTPDPYAVPSLPDKAPGVYEVLGPGTVLRRVVLLALRTGSDAGELAAQFAELLDAGFSMGLRLNQMTSASSSLAGQLGRLLACIDVVLAAAYTPQAVHNRAEDLRRGVLPRVPVPAAPGRTEGPAVRLYIRADAPGTAQGKRPCTARFHRERRNP